MTRVVFFYFVALHGRSLNFSSLCTRKTNGPPWNKYHNFGFDFNENMQLNGRQNAVVFVIFIEQEAR